MLGICVCVGFFCVCVCVCVCMRVYGCLCVHVCKRVSLGVYVGYLCVCIGCLCVCVRLRERECVYEVERNTDRTLCFSDCASCFSLLCASKKVFVLLCQLPTQIFILFCQLPAEEVFVSLCQLPAEEVLVLLYQLPAEEVSEGSADSQHHPSFPQRTLVHAAEIGVQHSEPRTQTPRA